MSELFRHPTPQAAAEAAANRIAGLMNEMGERKKQTNVAVSGGSTPKLLFQQLLTKDVDWSVVHLFWVDERAVPPTVEQSNYKLTKMGR